MISFKIPKIVEKPAQAKIISKRNLDFGCCLCLFDRTKLGEGASGSVYKAKYKNIQVAVKEFKPKANDESIIYSQINSPYIVKFIGESKKTKSPQFLVTELMGKGELHWEIYGTIARRGYGNIDWCAMTKIAFDIACAMNYLHSKGLVHDDIRTPNILIDDNYQAKLADFGFVAKEGTLRVRGFDEWSAPEHKDKNTKITTKTDIYSYGIVLLEIASDLEDRHPNPRYLKIYESRVPAIILNLIKDCTQDNPEDRPDAETILLRLVKLLNQKDLKEEKFEKEEDPATSFLLPPLTPKGNHRKLGIFKNDDKKTELTATQSSMPALKFS